MRFTKIPLIATLMAVALSLLIVLPALAQVSGDRTDGRQSLGGLDVRVAADLADVTGDANASTIGASEVPHAIGNGKSEFDARDTYFNGNLYVSNQEGAYNTIIITAAVADADLAATGTEEDCATSAMAAVAKIKNDRNGVTVTAYLIETNQNESGGVGIYQAIAAVWDQEDGVEAHNGPCGPHGDPMEFVETDTDATNNPDDGWALSSAAVIPARDGDTLTVTVDGVSGSIRLVVDGEAPDIDDISPADGGTQSSSTVNLGFTVSDDGAGIRYDGEAGTSADPDLTPFNGDGDQRFDEPITNKGSSNGKNDQDGDGSTMDIEVVYDSNDVSQYGSNDWTQRSKGVEYALDMRLVGQSFGSHSWQVTVKDRVGNSATTDADEDEDGNQAYSFKVDNDDPKVGTARTGIGYEAGEGEFKDRSWIALNFINETEGGPDRIDASTVQPSDFTVQGHTVVRALVPSDKKTCKGDVDDTDADESDDNITAFDAESIPAVSAVPDDASTSNVDESKPEVGAAEDCDFEPRARIYLQLDGELDSDDEPTIQLLGGVLRDIAGNNNVTQSLEDVMDKIAPGVSISITSSSGTSNRAATDDDGSFTVRVTSDEDLARFPKLYFATIKGTGGSTATALKIAVVSNAISMTEKETNTWEKKVNADDLPGTDDRILAAVVTAEDENGNSGNSAGWKGSSMAPAVEDGLDFDKLNGGGFLVEVDNAMEEADIEVLPSIDPGTVKNVTESVNPYIQINFDEAEEYGIAVTEADDGDAATTEASGWAYKADIGDGDSLSTDSHADVTITSLTLNGEDRLADVVRVKASQYVLAVTGLEVGEHTIVYTAMDDVGNELDEDEGEFEFEVQERQPYEVDLNPGWNLISVPGDPFNPAVDSVIGSDLKADTVLGYQAGEWVTAVRNGDGRWQGTLTEIVGGYGYWVRTSVVETIETVIPPTLPTSVLPTVPIISGWNLVGVIDAEQRDIGEDAAADVDEYLTSLKGTWRVAYSYDTQLNNWNKLLPDADPKHTVMNGSGYWLWNTRPGTLVP